MCQVLCWGQGRQVTWKDSCSPAALSRSFQLAFWAHKLSTTRVPISASHSAHRAGFRAGPRACWESTGFGVYQAWALFLALPQNSYVNLEGFYFLEEMKWK